MISKKSKEEYWRSHVTAGNKAAGGIASYCRQEGLPVATFHYWKRKLSRAPSLPTVSSAFIPVSVLRESMDLPDPQWLARFIGEFMRGVQ